MLIVLQLSMLLNVTHQQQGHHHQYNTKEHSKSEHGPSGNASSICCGEGAVRTLIADVGGNTKAATVALLITDGGTLGGATFYEVVAKEAGTLIGTQTFGINATILALSTTHVWFT